MTTLDLEPISGVLGAEVRGVDLADDLDDDVIAAIRSAFVTHQVLFFRDQQLDAEQQMAFGRRFGELDGLVAVHSAGSQYQVGGQSTKSKAMRTRNPDLAANEVEHPVVRTHPESGRKGLYVNRAFTTRIRGLRPGESKALLGFLFDHAVSERFTCRFRWRSGSLAMWDNRSVQHYALHDYAGQRRHMRRITVCGDKPV